MLPPGKRPRGHYSLFWMYERVNATCVKLNATCNQTGSISDFNFGDYKIHVFEIAFMDKEEVDLFQSDFRAVAEFFVQKRENGDYKPRPQDLKHVQETLQLLSVMTNDHRFEEVYNEASDAQKGEMRNMCEILDKIENRGIEKGRAEGKAEGIAEGRAKGKAEGIAEGNAEGKNQMADLMKRLLDENRIEDAKRAAEDPAYCDELMKQYGIG